MTEKMIAAILLASLVGLYASTISIPTTSSVPVITRLLDQAQFAYNERANLGRGKEAIVLWEEALKEDPASYEALWKLTRGYYWLGNHSPEEAQLEFFTKGKNYGQEATKLYPDRWEAHYWLGVCLGRYGETKGVLKTLFLIKPIKKEMETVLRFNPDHAGAHHVLGVLYRKAPGKPLSLGNKKKALQFARKAVELDPQSLKYKVGLAEAYLALDKKEEARTTLEETLSMPPNPQYESESFEEKEAALKLLENLKKED